MLDRILFILALLVLTFLVAVITWRTRERVEQGAVDADEYCDERR